MIKHALKILLFSSSLLLNAQQVDQDFLNSLPQDMQDDIRNQVEGAVISEDPIYRSIESQTKLEKRNLEDLRARLQEDLLSTDPYKKAQAERYLQQLDQFLPPSAKELLLQSNAVKPKVVFIFIRIFPCT